MAESNNSGILFDVAIDTEETVLDIREKALALMKEGKTLMSWTGEGVSSTKAFVMNVADVLVETRLFLKRKNPTKYGYLAYNTRQFRF